MVKHSKPIIAVLLATLWISLSEFLRNDVILKSFWVKHYQNIGLIFPDKPINGCVWGLWSLMFAVGIYVIASKFSLIQTTLISWFMAFVLMWITIGNLSVLPFKILWFAVPLSLLEAFVATWIIKIFQSSKHSI